MLYVENSASPTQNSLALFTFVQPLGHGHVYGEFPELSGANTRNRIWNLLIRSLGLITNLSTTDQHPGVLIASRRQSEQPAISEDPHGRKHQISPMVTPVTSPEQDLIPFELFATLSLGRRRADVGVHGASLAAWREWG